MRTKLTAGVNNLNRYFERVDVLNSTMEIRERIGELLVEYELVQAIGRLESAGGHVNLLPIGSGNCSGGLELATPAGYVWRTFGFQFEQFSLPVGNYVENMKDIIGFIDDYDVICETEQDLELDLELELEHDE